MRRMLFVVALLAALPSCTQTVPTLERIQPPWVGDCLDNSRQRVATALSETSLSSDGAALVGQLLANLPSREKAAIAASLDEARRLLGHTPTLVDIDRLRDGVANQAGVAYQAFFLGFHKSPTCDVEDGYLTVDIFTSSVIAHLYKRGIDVSAAFVGLGSPPSEFSTDHGELKIWLLLGAAGAL